MSNSRRSRRVIHFVFSELPLLPLDHRFPRAMAGLRVAVGLIVTALAVIALFKGLWWGILLVAPVAGLIWTGYIDLTLARRGPHPQGQV
jgi:hypothetical protein